MVRYEGEDEDLDRLEIAEDEVRSAMLKGDGKGVCRLLGIKGRFRLQKY